MDPFVIFRMVIIYCLVLVFTLESIQKLLHLSRLKSQLGNGYKSIPDRRRIPVWRWLAAIPLLLTAIAGIIISLNQGNFSVQPLLLIPFAFALLLRGRIYFGFYNNTSLFFYNEQGFVILSPRLVMPAIMTEGYWSDLSMAELQKVEGTKVYVNCILHFSEGNKALSFIINAKQQEELIKEINQRIGTSTTTDVEVIENSTGSDE